MVANANKAAHLRVRYTGEPLGAAVQFVQAHGLQFGLIPDAFDPRQQHLEAAVLQALTRPDPALAAAPALDPAPWGLAGVSPGLDSLVLRPAPGQAAALLLRLLPGQTRSGTLTGLPGLRAQPSPRRHDTLVLSYLHRAHIEVRANPAALQDVRRAAQTADLRTLWDADGEAPEEEEARYDLVAALDRDQARVWSRALRRQAVARPTAHQWRNRPPRLEELHGPHPDRIAPRIARSNAWRGAVAVVPADGKGGLGCSTAAYALAAAAATSGARVGLLADPRPSGIAAMLGLEPDGDGQPRWIDAGSQLARGAVLKAALLPVDPAAAAHVVDQARTEFDTVVIDPGTVGPSARIAAAADVVLTLAAAPVWHTTEVLDARSPRVRLWEYLDNEMENGGTTVSLQSFLDITFERYVQWRTQTEDLARPGSDDDPTDTQDGWLHAVADDAEDEMGGTWDDDLADDAEPYDPDDHDAAARFWALANRRWRRTDDDMWLALPTEQDEPRLARWRQEFLQILTPQGTLRHGTGWEAVQARWIERNRGRNRARIGAGLQLGREKEQGEAALVALLREDGHARWGSEQWQRESTAWLAADNTERQTVRRSEAALRRFVQRPAESIAADLRHQVRLLHVPAGHPVVWALTRLPRDPDRQLLAQVAAALRSRGPADLIVLPKHGLSMEEWLQAPVLPPQMLAFGQSLAATVIDVAEHR